jgi:outer membrane immunogenic protein
MLASYTTGGLAVLGAEAHGTSIAGFTCGQVNFPSCSKSPLKGGATFGVGAEWGFAPNWSAKLEYLYIAQIDGLDIQKLNTIRAGINYLFSGN